MEDNRPPPGHRPLVDPIAAIADRASRVIAELHTGLAAGERIRTAARKQELEDEMTAVRIRAEGQAKMTAFHYNAFEELRQRPQTPAQVITQIHQPIHVHNNVTNIANNLHNNVTNLTQNVHHAHEHAIHFIQNNANRVINIAANVGSGISDIYNALPDRPRSAQAALMGRG